MKYLFDVDGTLTPSRQKIEKDHEYYLMDFFSYYDCSIVTGSDYGKTYEQLGSTIMNLAEYSFNCSGNVVYQKQKEINRNLWTCPDNLREFLNSSLDRSGFDIRTGNHIEERPGTINFSIVGRNANLDERHIYTIYDNKFNERVTIARSINDNFDGIEAVVGGETGIDIFEKGKDKRQILEYFNDNETFCFFGDKIIPGGNDYTLAKVLEKRYSNTVFNVSSPEETFRILQQIDGRE
jgi:phosphomannomutase